MPHNKEEVVNFCERWSLCRGIPTADKIRRGKVLSLKIIGEDLKYEIEELETKKVFLVSNYLVEGY